MSGKTAWTAWAVKNSIVMICFTALAFHFEHWWIALFACLCMSSLERKPAGAGRTCDGCGRVVYADDLNGIDDAARRAGWVRRKNVLGKWEDFCPECQRKGMGSYDA